MCTFLFLLPLLRRTPPPPKEKDAGRTFEKSFTLKKNKKTQVVDRMAPGSSDELGLFLSRSVGSSASLFPRHTVRETATPQISRPTFSGFVLKVISLSLRSSL